MTNHRAKTEKLRENRIFRLESRIKTITKEPKTDVMND